eukprot:1895498-Prymnesium_polylepis.2
MSSCGRTWMSLGALEVVCVNVRLCFNRCLKPRGSRQRHGVLSRRVVTRRGPAVGEPEYHAFTSH